MSKIVYASTYNALDLIVYQNLNKHSSLILPHNTAQVARGAVKALQEKFIDLKHNLPKTSDASKLGKHYDINLRTSKFSSEVLKQKLEDHEVHVSYLYVQTSFGRRLPYNKKTHVDLEKFESGFKELITLLENKYGNSLKLGMTYFGAESSYSTPWLDIQSALSRCLDMTDHELTVFIPQFLSIENPFFKGILGTPQHFLIPRYLKDSST